MKHKLPIKVKRRKKSNNELIQTQLSLIIEFLETINSKIPYKQTYYNNELNNSWQCYRCGQWIPANEIHQCSW